MTPILFAMPGNERLAEQLCAARSWQFGNLQTRQFPDGESYVRFLTDIAGHDIAIVCTLDFPDQKVMPLYLAASIARELGAKRIGLVVPYLAYMRQDARFQSGEGITAAHFARLISGVCDWLVTVDPHLHRILDLSEVYSVPTRVVRAAPEIARWIAANVERPLIIGPDAESEQWVAEVAGTAYPYTVLQKTRHGDHDVEVSVPDIARWRDRTPVLVDDIASTARTMIAAVSHLRAAGAAAPVCIAVHAIFTGSAYTALQGAGVARIVSCNTILHESNQIDLHAPVGRAMQSLLEAPVA